MFIGLYLLWTLPSTIAALEWLPPPITSISELSFSPGEMVAQVHTFDQTMIVFVTREEFRFYGVDRGHSIREKGRKRHLIRNLAEDYLSCWVTPVYIAVYRKFSMSIFLLSEDGNSFNEAIKYPSSYFGLEEFTKIKAFNAWKGKLFMKIGPQDVFELSLASPRNPEWRKITLKKRWLLKMRNSPSLSKKSNKKKLLSLMTNLQKIWDTKM